MRKLNGTELLSVNGGDDSNHVVIIPPIPDVFRGFLDGWNS